MTVNSNKNNSIFTSIATAKENLEHLHHYILDLQGAPEIDDLWSVFLNDVKGMTKLVGAKLVYKAGLLFDQLDLVGDRITRKALSRFSFPEFKEDFELKRLKKKVVVFKREDGRIAHMDLTFAENLDIDQKDDWWALFSVVSHIFMNQLFLLLRIKNYEHHSIKDDITLAYNQNYLKAFIQNEIERAKRYATVFSIIFFDLDNLKAINEKYGHLVGTEVLKEVAAILRSQVRTVDLLSRFGGDEFVIVLLHAEPVKAYEVCLRIQHRVNNHVFLKNKNLDIHITGCFGISSFPENGVSVDDLIRKADLAMYDVKHKGKDGVKIYEEE